jgi:hypothetical protein
MSSDNSGLAQNIRQGEALIKQLKAYYTNFDISRLDELGSLYTQDVEFVDPIERINGLFALKHYLRKQSGGLNFSRFRYINELVGENQAFIRWEMEFSHPKLAKGKVLILPGMSEVHFTQRIFYQQDCYDLGAMLYEHLPVLGFAVRTLKGRLAS